MNKRILLGIDLSLTPATQYAMRAAKELMEHSSPQLRLVLLCVIPLPSIASSSAGMYAGHLMPLTVTHEQRTLAEDVLHHVRLELQKADIAPEQMEALIRVGLPADEIVKVARELHVNIILIGSRGNTMQQRIRRFFMGSISRRVLQLAPCPVMIVPSPETPHPSNLVAWYEEAITAYLQQHPEALTVFTPHEVAQKFVPPRKKTAGRKEIAAATLALEELAGSGVLCRHDVKGELRYVND